MSKKHKKISDNTTDNRSMILERQITQSMSFSGPLPHPEILKKFDEVVPGAAERIIKMTEDQSSHRRDLEQKVISSDISRSKIGQIFGFIIAIAGLVVAVVLAKTNAILGSTFGFLTLASLVGVFVYGTKTRSNERKEKDS